MTDFNLLALKARMLRTKLAADDDWSPAGAAGWGGAGVASLGASGKMLHSGYKSMTPSILDLGEKAYAPGGESYQGIMAQLRGLKIRKGLTPSPMLNQQAGLLLDYHDQLGRLDSRLRNQPGLLRSLLAGKAVPGVSPLAVEDFRNVAFGDRIGTGVGEALSPEFFTRPATFNNPRNFQAGDVFLQTDTRAGKGFMTGGNYSHIMAATGNERVNDLMPTTTNQPVGTPHRADRSQTLPDKSIQMRPTLNTPIKALPEKHPLVHDKLVYDHKLLGNLGLREILPELGVGKGQKHLLSPVADQAGNHASKIKGIVPEEIHAKMIAPRNACAPGDVCSTYVGRAAEAMQPGVLRGRDPSGMTPNAFARASDAYKPVAMHLPEQLRTPDFLRKQNLLKYGPLAVRTLPTLGLASFGTYALNHALNTITASTRKTAPPQIKPIAPAPIPYQPPGQAAGGASGSWWQQMQKQFGGKP